MMNGKKKNKKMLLMIGVIVLSFASGGCLGGYLVYHNYVKEQEAKQDQLELEKLEQAKQEQEELLQAQEELLQAQEQQESAKQEQEELLKALSEKVDDNLIEHYDYCNDYFDEKKIISVQLDSLRLKEDTPAYEAINSDIELVKREFGTYTDQIGNTIICRINSGGEPVIINIDCKIGYNANGIFSFYYDYHDGELSSPYRANYIYNLKDGKRISISELLAIPLETFNQKASASFKKLIHSNPDSYIKGAIDLISSENDYTQSGYLAEDGIHVYYEPNIISEDPFWYPEIVIPYDGILSLE